MSLFKRVIPLLLLPLVAALGACSSPKPKFQDDQLFSSTTSPFSRNFDFAANDACEAARRGLLSQGYMTTSTHPDAVDATKNFQPASDTHIVVEVHVVCTAADAANTSVVYVNAVQNGYALKKSDTSASVGLSIFGSLSVPIRTNNDAMVKISSETIQSGAFYEKFFDLVGRYLRTSVRSEPVPHGAIEITPLPPVTLAPTLAVVTPPSAPAPAAQAPTPEMAHAAVPGVAVAALAPAEPAAPTPLATAAATAAAANTAISAATNPVTSAATSAAANAAALTLPGIGQPPILTAPANYAATAAPPATDTPAPPPATHAAASDTTAAASPAAATPAPGSTPVAATPTPATTTAAATPTSTTPPAR